MLIKEALGKLISLSPESGLSRIDLPFAKSLYEKENFTPEQERAIERMLARYSQTLTSAGIDFDNVLKVKPLEDVKTAWLDFGRIYLKFTTHSETEFYNILEKIKGLPGRQFHSKEKMWSCPPSMYCIDRLLEWGFEVDKNIKFRIKNNQERESRAVTMACKLPETLKLRPYQEEDLRFIETHNGKALIGEEVGLGKTEIAIAYLASHPELRPAVIICPASLKTQWEKRILKYLHKEKIGILSGRNGEFYQTNSISIINYDIIHDYIEFLEGYAKVYIIDEAHRLKSVKSKRTKAIKYLAKFCEHKIYLSATPVQHKTMDFFPMLNMIDPEQFPNQYQFGMEYCGAENTGWGWNFSGASNTRKLYEILHRDIMIRHDIKDIIKDLPEENPIIVNYDMQNKPDYDLAERDIIEYIHKFEGQDAAKIASNAEAIVKISKLRQLAVKGIITSILEWLDDYKESGQKLVLFSVHHETTDALMNKFTDVAVKHDGTCSPKQKQEAIDKFINDPNTLFFFGQIKASGEGVDGLQKICSNVGFVELDWGPKSHDQAIGRVGGARAALLGRKSVNVFWFIANDSIMEKMAKIIDEKRKLIDKIIDGEDVKKESMISELIKEYQERKI